MNNAQTPVIATAGERTFKKTLGVLREYPELGRAIARMRRVESAATHKLGRDVLDEIPSFSASHNPDVVPDLERHAAEHINEILRLLESGELGDFGFVRRHAERRAEQRFPLEATLHAYRRGHKVLLRILRDAIEKSANEATNHSAIATALADFTIDYTDAVSTVAANAYVAHTRLLADVAADERTELLNILLDGYDESDGRVVQLLRDAGYVGRRQSFCVVLARSLDPLEMHNPARARRAADAVAQMFADTAYKRVIDVRDYQVIAILSDGRRASGWVAPTTDFADRVARRLATLGNMVVVGVSDDGPSTASIPLAYRQAKLALKFAQVSNRVVQFSTIRIQDVMQHLAGDELTAALPAWASEFKRADDKVNGTYLRTLGAYADANMNVINAARKLAVHPNTIYARFAKIGDISGLDPRSYHELTELLVVAKIAVPHFEADG